MNNSWESQPCPWPQLALLHLLSTPIPNPSSSLTPFLLLASFSPNYMAAAGARIRPARSPSRLTWRIPTLCPDLQVRWSDLCPWSDWSRELWVMKAASAVTLLILRSFGDELGRNVRLWSPKLSMNFKKEKAR